MNEKIKQSAERIAAESNESIAEMLELLKMNEVPGWLWCEEAARRLRTVQGSNPPRPEAVEDTRALGRWGELERLRASVSELVKWGDELAGKGSHPEDCAAHMEDKSVEHCDCGFTAAFDGWKHARYEVLERRGARLVESSNPYHPLYRCTNCGDPVTDHEVDDEERRECRLCECRQYEAPGVRGAAMPSEPKR